MVAKIKSNKRTRKPLRGNALLRAVVNRIIESPEAWDQTCWHGKRAGCGTTHCVAGWAQVLGGIKPCKSTARNDAAQLLELNYSEADYLFSGGRTFQDIYGFALGRLSVAKLPDGDEYGVPASVEKL